MKINLTSKKIYNSHGFSLVEMLIYLGIMTVITIILVESFLVVLKSNSASFVDMNLRNSGYSAMEAMTREIRASEDISQISANILELKQNNNTNLVKFSTTSEGTLIMSEGFPVPSVIGPLTIKGTKVLDIVFKRIDTTNSKAVRISLNLSSSAKDQTKNEWFYTTVILRGSY